ncbi:MAG: hypothetical protein Q8R00_04385 [Candidatus Nanoarchaeia archaeon]|nr:hypothetical protein [Candidatus Nanoarchaeia archaeon]
MKGSIEEIPKPYFLHRMDTWHSNRLERILTPETKNRVADLFIEVIDENPLNEQKDNEISREEINSIAEDLRSSYKDFFSNIYSSTDKIVKGKLGNIPKIKKEACLIDLMEFCRELLKFPSLVQKIAEDFEEQIKEEELDRLFLQSYKTPGRFSDIFLGYQDAQLQLLYHPANKLQFELVQAIEAEFEINRKIMPYVNSLVFADLDKAA